MTVQSPEEKKKGQNWEADVAVPFAQNLLGGIATYALVLAWAEYSQRWTDHAHAEAILSGIAITAIATIVRFFGDDLGIIRHAYQAGARSRDGEIYQLNRQIQRLEATAVAGTGQATPTSDNRRLDLCEWSRKHAEKLATIGIRGGDITRRGDHGIGAKSWERARNLLIASKVWNPETGQWASTKQTEVLGTLKAYYQPHYERMKTDPKYTPAWLLTG